jgi:pimeloyl-ACP methyl ester carboxylesterase
MGEIIHWNATLEILADICRPMALALPVLDSTLPGLSPPELAEYVCRFLDARDIPRAVVGGNSLGGHVALELALARLDRVSGLILTGSSGLSERSFTRGVPHRPSPAWVQEKMEEIFYDAGQVTPEWVEWVWHNITTRQSFLRILQAARAAKSRNVEAWLPTIEVPTLIVWGLDDRITPPAVAYHFHALIPDAELAWVPDCGHAPMPERPAAFSAILRAWLLRTRRHRERSPLLAGSLR